MKITHIYICMFPTLPILLFMQLMGSNYIKKIFLNKFPNLNYDISTDEARSLFLGKGDSIIWEEN